MRRISEWEELESLSKDELIIELMKERTAHRELNRALLSLIELDYPSDRVLPVYSDDDDSDYGRTSEDWISRIAEYAYRNSTDKESFSYTDLRSYGLSDDMADVAYLHLRQRGFIKNESHDLEGWFRSVFPIVVGGMGLISELRLPGRWILVQGKVPDLSPEPSYPSNHG